MKRISTKVRTVMVFSKRQYDAIALRATREDRKYREVCGLLVDNGDWIEMIPIRNISRRIMSFRFSAPQVRAVENASKVLGHEVIGTYHSHLATEISPSSTDIEWTLDDSMMMIISSISRKAKLWCVTGGKLKSVRFRFA